MATVTKPIALDESLNTTEVTPRNIADVLADELSNIASKIQGSGSSVSWNQLQVTGDKIAEITISGVKTDVMSHSIAVSRIQTTGTHIADITIDGVKTELYAPQGSPSFNALIIVTAETGKTVTATKGGDTYTATEVSTGTYEVSVDSAGTWTISDGTLSDTVSVVSQTTYYVTLSSVPDGKTVTPTDDISIWLQCGQRSENYTTLAEVLADSTCLSALMADNNAVDYLVRSKEFAIVSGGLVPVMTGYTTPSGEVITSENNTGLEGYNAFNPNLPQWAARTSGAYLGYIFTEPTCVKAFMMQNFSSDADNIRINTFKVCARNSNSDAWIDLTGTLTNVSGDSAKYYGALSNSTKYLQYAIFVLSGMNVTWTNMLNLQFYESEGLTLNATAMSYIGLNNYCANTLLADSDWCEAICNSTYFESVLNVKVPTMTSNTTPSGECLISQQYLSYPAYYSFNGDSSNYAIYTKALNGYLGYKFPSAKRIYKCVIVENEGDFGTDTFVVKASDDGSTYVAVSDTFSMSEATHKIIITDSTPHTHFIVSNTTNNTAYSGYFWTSTQFYGREDV